jgi:hypothetical protein
MKTLTTKARAVLEAASGRDGVIGARRVAHILGFGRKFMRAGQYAGRLARAGWLVKRTHWYRGRRGHDVYSHVEYFITEKGRKILLDSRNRGK